MLVDFDQGAIHHHSFQLRFQVFGQLGEPVIIEHAEHAFLTPAVATPVNGVPLAELRRQVAPGRAGACDPEYGFQDGRLSYWGSDPPGAGTPARQVSGMARIVPRFRR